VPDTPAPELAHDHLDPDTVDECARAAFDAAAANGLKSFDDLDPGERMTWRESAEAAIRRYLAVTR
jgi:hypothetical protein